MRALLRLYKKNSIPRFLWLIYFYRISWYIKEIKFYIWIKMAKNNSFGGLSAKWTDEMIEYSKKMIRIKNLFRTYEKWHD